MPEPEIRLTPDAAKVWDALTRSGLMTQELEQALRRLSLTQSAVDTLVESFKAREWQSMPSLAHCWQKGRETEDGRSTTCMEWDNHEGPHEFVPDDEILMTFLPRESD